MLCSLCMAMPVFADQWQKDDRGWRYCLDGGTYSTGWVYDQNNWYYLQNDTYMSVGWISYQNKWYYLTSSGAMAAGWVYVGSDWYYLNKDGDMAANAWIGNHTYYVGGNGAMLADATTPDGYYVNNFGVCEKTGEKEAGSSKRSTSGNSASGGDGFFDAEEFCLEVIDLVNKERRKAGKGELERDETLMDYAAVRGEELLEKFSHTRPDGTSALSADELSSYSSRGENIAAGQRSPEEVMNSWMNSAGHKANILNSSYSNIGVGLAVTDSGYGYYWVQVFGD